MCHGDVWSNNMMFGQDDDHVTLIDFQMIGSRHPAGDLWYFLTVNTDKVAINCMLTFRGYVIAINP